MRGSAAFADILLLAFLISLAAATTTTIFQPRDLKPEPDAFARTLLFFIQTADARGFEFKERVLGFELDRRLETGRTLAELADEVLFLRSHGEDTGELERGFQRSLSWLLQDLPGFGFSITFSLENSENFHLERDPGSREPDWHEVFDYPSALSPGRLVSVDLGVWR